jgi:hypothetical protein
MRKVIAFEYIEIFGDLRNTVKSFWLFLMYYPEKIYLHRPFVVKGRSSQSFDNLADAVETYEAELKRYKINTWETLV